MKMAEWIQIFATTVAKMSHKGLEMGNPAQILDEKPFLLIFRLFFFAGFARFLVPCGTPPRRCSSQGPQEGLASAGIPSRFFPAANFWVNFF